MPPIPSFPNPSNADYAGYERVLSCFKKDLKTDPIVLDRLNIEQMFVLIEGVLPIEACLYYQILPLFLEGSRLHLGMVSPEDKAASDYVRRIVSYLNYSLVTWTISSDALKASLSAYLRYADQSSALSRQQPSAATRRANRINRDQAPRKTKVDAATHPTLVVDSPDAIDPSLDEMLDGENQSAEPADHQRAAAPSDSSSNQHSQPATPDTHSSDLNSFDLDETQIISEDDQAVEAPEISSVEGGTEPSSEIDSSEMDNIDNATPADVPGSDSTPLVSPAFPPPSSSAVPPLDFSSQDSELHLDFDSLQRSGDSPLSINLTEQYGQDRLDRVGALSPKVLLQKLLVRVLDQGIGRLYFEQRGQTGRILWSENGVLQSIVDDITPLQFRGVISELKGMTRMPLAPIQKPCQVELERVYQDERILLRFRFIPTDVGEDATLQVLRGAALRFYQQQQLSRLGRDALTIAQELHSKVSELRDRTLNARGLPDHQAQLLPRLAEMIQQIETQINELQLPSDEGR